MNQLTPVVNERKVKMAKSDEVSSLEALIKSHAESINKMKDELKRAREMYQDGFSNDPGFRKEEEKVKEATKLRSKVKEAIASNPNNVVLKQKMTDLRIDIKESQETLSELLLDYNHKTEATQLEIWEGQIFDIVRRARIVKRSSK